MSMKNHMKEMVATKNKHKALSCSTPERRADSPSRDSDSICDSEAASPVPFLCTQDGAEGETDVVWNFYTPKSANKATSRVKSKTPLGRKPKRTLRPKVIEKPLPKRRALKISQKKTELFQDLIELNRNLHDLIAKKQSYIPEKPQSGSDDDIFSETQVSPKCIPRGSSRCLRKNVLSSNFTRPDPDAALESDDSMNECLLKASQIVEEKILKCEQTPAKRTRQSMKLNYRNDKPFQMANDSMDAILNCIKLESPVITKVKKCESPCLNNDSFDNFVGNLNDSALEQLTQMPINTSVSMNLRSKDWTVKELTVHDTSPSSKSFFGRHSSMPESPSIPDNNKPSTSGMAFARYNSMPFDNQADIVNNGSGDSPIRCTQDEIKKKHQQARERLLAKRLLPFTSSPQSQPVQQPILPKKSLFQPKFASKNVPISNTNQYNTRSSIPIQNDNKNIVLNENNSSTDIKSLIEKKRQEALMKLRRRQPQNK